MLGEMISEGKGKISALRVLPSEGMGPRMEVSFQGSGKLLGQEVTEVGTYISTLMPNGVLNGSGQGLVTTKSGEVATWTGTGVGRPTGRGMAASWRGSICYQTTSQSLSGLNKIAGIFEHEVDENGNTTEKLWEWK
ncbi:MAG: hypothetical protein A3F78_18055 [Burkholderiales bacterium RIFCSPLOWO2_12_FULL_61_40]|nr:MAG: hypothetical protein A3F78_18055 [Burkholderiales bacterium RIFCSPLOWO2_12_FULL_61_40]